MAGNALRLERDRECQRMTPQRFFCVFLACDADVAQLRLSFLCDGSGAKQDISVAEEDVAEGVTAFENILVRVL